MNWEVVKLGDVFKISSGGTPSRGEDRYFVNGSIPWVKTGELKGKYASKPNEYITQEALSNSSAKIFPENTVLLAMYGATIGACSILPFEAATNQACAALLPSTRCDSVYLYYYLTSIKDELIRMGVGGAQPNISGGIIKKIKIPLPPLATQKNIAAILDAADAHRQKTKQLLAKYDELAQSIFLEMFGDPVTNPKGWEEIQLGKACAELFLGLTSKVEYVDHGGFPLIRATDINSGELSFNNVKYISEAQHRKLTKLRITKIGDLLISKSGSLGTCAINHTDKEFSTYESIFTLRAKENVLSNVYMQYLIRNESFQKQLIGKKVGGTVAHLNLKMFRDYKLNLPPYSLQKDFQSKVEIVEDLKRKGEKEYLESENLFNGLLQKAFKGELVN